MQPRIFQYKRGFFIFSKRKKGQIENVSEFFLILNALRSAFRMRNLTFNLAFFAVAVVSYGCAFS